MYVAPNTTTSRRIIIAESFFRVKYVAIWNALSAFQAMSMIVL